MANRMMRWFEWQHLPAHLQAVSKSCRRLAQEMDMELPEGAEKTTGLRKLLEAKDCFVRARLEIEDALQPVPKVELDGLREVLGLPISVEADDA